MRFVRSFTTGNHPELLLLTGGEPLLDPETVRQLAVVAKRAGSRVCVISGMFFARARAIPRPIRRAIKEVNHFTASMDEFHQAQVPLRAVIRCINEIRELGVDVSIQATVRSLADPYLEDLMSAIREQSREEIPMLLGTIGAVGRAQSFIKPSSANRDDMLQPCAFAAWPTVTWDGTVVACCNQSVVDGDVPAHLRLGKLSLDDWPAIRRRCETRPMLRALRFYGPVAVTQAFQPESPQACSGYCDSCKSLPETGSLPDAVASRFSGSALRKLEQSFMTLQQDQASERYSRGLSLPYSDTAIAEQGPFA